MRRARLLLLFAVVLVVVGAVVRLCLILPPAAPVTMGREVAGHYDYAGLIHGHSGYSGDAYGSYDDLSKAAAAQGLSFVVLTEHNNLDATRDGVEGWRNGVLMLSGVESTRPEGYLLAIGTETYRTSRMDDTGHFLSEAASQNGLVLLAHPTRPKWQWRGAIDERMAGMEILDLADAFYAARLLDKLELILVYPFKREAAFLDLYDTPDETLKRWDAITATRRFVGTYGPDFHQSIQISRSLRVHLPPAGDLMHFARNHVVMPAPFSGEAAPDTASLLGAIRDGHLYVSVDLIGDATGFMFSATRGAAQAWMGDELAGEGATRFQVDLPKSAGDLHPTVRILRNGEEVNRQSWMGEPIVFSAADAGTYRVEVRTRVPEFFGGTREIVWIYSNPIYVSAAS